VFKSIIKVDTKVNTTIPGMQGYNRKKPLDEKMFKAKEDYEKYSWLIKG
jgi:hypothetical protein